MHEAFALIPSVLSRAWDGYLPVALFLLVEALLGSAFLRTPLFRAVSFSSRAERLLFSTFAGMYLSYLLLTGLALAGLLDLAGLAAAGLAATAAGLYAERRALLGLPSGLLRALRVRGRPVAVLLWAAAGLALFAWILPFFLQTLLPNTDWDSALVHLPLPEHFLAHGLLTLDPMRTSFAVPAAVHLFYAAFLAAGRESAVIPLNFAVLLLTAAAAYCLAARFWGRSAGLWSAGVLLSSNIMLELALDPRIDGFLAAFVLMAFYAFLLWLNDSRKLGHLVLCAMMLGMGMGTKATAVFPAGVLGLWILASGARHSWRSKRLFLKHLAWFLAILAVPSAFWYVRNIVLFQDPVYPRLSGSFYVSPSGERKVASRAIKAALSGQLSGAQARKKPAAEAGLRKPGPRVQKKPAAGARPRKPGADAAAIRGLKQSISKKYPDEASEIRAQARPRTLFNLPKIFWQQTSAYAAKQRYRQTDYERKPLHFMSPLLVVFLLLPLARRDRSSLVLYVVGLSLYVIVGVQTHLLRYALFVMPLLSVGTALLISRVRHWAWQLAWGVLLCALLVHNSVQEWGKASDMRAAAFLSGGLDRLAWLSEVGYSSSPSTPRAIRKINDLVRLGVVPRDATILMVYEGKGRLLACRHIDDDSWTGGLWTLDFIESGMDYARLAAALKQRGVDYVLLNTQFATWLFLRTQADRNLTAFVLYHVERFLEEQATLVFEQSGIVFARLK